MAHVFTVKFPEALRGLLEEAARRQGRSKGALVREAVERVLKGEVSTGDQVLRITEALRTGKKVRVKVDWNELRRKAQSSTALSPEEEVRLSRRRGL